MPLPKPEIVLDDCRELMTNRLRSSLSRMMGNLEEILFDLAAQDECKSEGAFYIDAVRELRLKKKEIQVRFENRLSGIYVDIVRQLTTSSKEIKSPEMQSDKKYTGIVKDLDEINVLHEPVENTRNECRQALHILDQNINSILKNLNVNGFINPMQPETVYNAFWDSCDDLQCGAEIRLIMLQMFERQVATDLGIIYDDINVLMDFFLKDAYAGSDEHPYSDRIADASHSLQENIYGNSQLMKTWAQNYMLERVAGQELPEMIIEFLKDHWSELLVDIFCKYSKESLEWERAIHVIDDLVKCATLTHDRQSRLHQIWQFPGLIYRLKTGMKLISVPLNIQARFISDLKLLHCHLTEQNLNSKNN